MSSSAAAPELDARRAASSACFTQAEFTVVRSRPGSQHARGPDAYLSSGVTG
jgi:hypothetical protein